MVELTAGEYSDFEEFADCRRVTHDFVDTNNTAIPPELTRVVHIFTLIHGRTNSSEEKCRNKADRYVKLAFRSPKVHFFCKYYPSRKIGFMQEGASNSLVNNQFKILHFIRFLWIHE